MGATGVDEYISRTALVLAGFALSGALAMPARAQPAAPVNIPLTLVTPSGGTTPYQLGINVGINGGPSQRYLFDTGSALFNTKYQTSVPSSPLSGGNNVGYQYGPNGAIGTVTGNLQQVQSLTFYNQSGGAAASLAANPGYVVNSISSVVAGSAVPDFGNNFNGTNYNGIFGAGNFASWSPPTGTSAPSLPPPGGILGQTQVSNVAQGYVLSANGWLNPASSSGLTQQPNGVTVQVGGVTQSIACSPCVTVGLTPQMIGQFAPVAQPGPASQAGVVPVAVGPNKFNNPYGGVAQNNGSTAFGASFTTSAISTAGQVTTATTVPTLLDTGASLATSQVLNVAGISTNPGVISTTVGTLPGVRFSVTGVTGSGAAVPGLPAATATLTGSRSSTVDATYNGSFYPPDNPPATTCVLPNTCNRSGLWFFLQNSVMYDLNDNVIGYTPFFVTDTALATTANGPLVVGNTNVPLGLAGVVSGPGGITVNNGGALQLSATNVYTGPTTIANGGQLYISGPGSIASSSGVVNNGVFDISRAWAPVSIQALSGAGQVSLGAQNLIITNASGTFSGAIADGGAFPAAGGSVAIAGGTQTLSGASTYTGGTLVGQNATLNLTGSILGNLALFGTMTSTGGYAVAPNAVFLNAGTFQSLGGAPLVNQGALANAGLLSSNLVNAGALVNNGTILGNVSNGGALAGSGTIVGNVVNAGVITPGNSIGTMSIAGSYTQTAGGSYVAEVSANQSDRINVTGPATLGGVVNVVAVPGTVFAGRTTYTLLNATAGRSGTFASVNELYPFLLSSLSYDASNAYLNLQIGGFAAAAQTQAQFAVGRVLDANAVNATGDFATILGTLATLPTSNVLPFMTAISGQNYSSFSSFMVQGAQLFMSNFANQTGGGGSPVSNRVALAEACDVACDGTLPSVWGAWGGALGGLGVIGSGASTGALTYNVGGFAAGLDRLVMPSFRAGVTVGYTTGTQWTSGFSGNGTTDSFLTGLYGNYREGRVYADAVAGYAYSYNQMWRQISIPTMQQRLAQGRTGSNQWYGQIEGGYRVDIGRLGTVAADTYVTPFMRWQGYTGTQNGFTETGAQSLNLTVAQQTTNSLRSVIGAQLGGAFDLGWREKLALQFRLGWSHEYASTARPVTATLGGAPLMPFTTYGIAPTRDGAVVGFAANTAIADGTSLYLRYEGNISGQDSAHALTAGVRMTW